MSKKILIDASNSDQTRIAVTENEKLDDFEIESNKKNSVKGDVYILEKYHLFIQLKKKPYLYKLLYQKKIFGFIVNNLRRYIFIK